MKINKFVLIFIPAFLLTSCSDRLPDSYGIYLSSNHELTIVNPQSIILNGNLLESISGLKCSSGRIFRNVDHIIVYEQDIKPEDIKVSKLRFNKGTYVRNLLGNSYVELNLWTSEKEIPVNIAPVHDKKDMYKITPTQPLDSGFYAIHFGSLTNRNTPEAFNKAAYDFVIGSSIEPYQSTEIIMNRNEQIFTTNAEILLHQINDSFNKKNYDDIRKIYRKTDGGIFDDSEWISTVEGFKNWSLQAGQIKSSKIVGRRIEDNNGTFSIQTEYEKNGLVNEEMTIIRNNNSYFITFIGTN